MHPRRIIILILILLGSSVLLFPLTLSAASWSPPFALGGGNIKPAVAVDAQGVQHYVWWTNDGGIQYSRCTGLGGNGCSAPVNLPTNGPSYYPSIAIDPRGRPNVVFETKNNGATRYDVWWTRRQGNGWSTPQKISSEPYAELPDIAIGPGGVIHVIYQSKQGDTGYVYYTRSTDGFNFDRAVELDAAPSDAPLTDFGALAEQGLILEPEGSRLSNGLYPRIAADANDDAHAVWNAPSPYGIKYRYQTNGNWNATINVASGQKDQTPDVAVAPDGAVGIIWGTYDDFNAAFAEYNNGDPDQKIDDVDGGLAQSLWPKIEADCTGIFHFAFQGSVNANSQWNIYYRSYDPATDTFTKRQTIAQISAQEQTPAISATHIAAIVYNNSTNSIIDAATADLGISCGPVPTPTTTATPTDTPTPDPNVTPTMTPTPGGEIWIPNASNQIQYRKSWKKYKDDKATDNNYHRCEKDGVCEKFSAAKIIVPDGYTQVEWYTAKSSTYGIAKVWINDELFETKDMCQGNNGVAPKFVKFKYTIPPRGDGQPRTFEIGAPSRHSSCSPYNSNFVVVDGFKLLP